MLTANLLRFGRIFCLTVVRLMNYLSSQCPSKLLHPWFKDVSGYSCVRNLIVQIPWLETDGIFVYRFFRYMLLLFLMHQMAIALFRLIGALGRTMVIASTFGSFALVVAFVLGGFILAKRKASNILRIDCKMFVSMFTMLSSFKNI